MARRTGKSGGEQAAQQGSENLQQQLMQKASDAGLMVADNFQAQMLVSALTSIQSGAYGEKTQAILDAIGAGTTSPLEEWSNQLAAWNQPALLPSSSEFTG